MSTVQIPLLEITCMDCMLTAQVPESDERSMDVHQSLSSINCNILHLYTNKSEILQQIMFSTSKLGFIYGLP